MNNDNPCVICQKAYDDMPAYFREWREEWNIPIDIDHKFCYQKTQFPFWKEEK